MGLENLFGGFPVVSASMNTTCGPVERSSLRAEDRPAVADAPIGILSMVGCALPLSEMAAPEPSSAADGPDLAVPTRG